MFAIEIILNVMIVIDNVHHWLQHNIGHFVPV